MFSRTQAVVGKQKMEKIKKLHIAVLGLGGVGGYVVEMLSRLGVMELTIVDFDKVDKSNINRQIIATTLTIGKLKTDAFMERISSINANCKVNAFNTKLDNCTVPQILDKNFDYVIDCIDDIKAKIEVVKHCKNNNLNLICSMGTGNRYKQPKFEVTDISKTSYDKLAKKMRKLLKDEGITKLDVVYTKESPEQTESLGSVVQYPLVCAGTIVGFVIEKLLGR